MLIFLDLLVEMKLLLKLKAELNPKQHLSPLTMVLLCKIYLQNQILNRKVRKKDKLQEITVKTKIFNIVTIFTINKH